MLLAIDVGNSHTVLALGEQSFTQIWRISTHPVGTGDEFKLKLEALLSRAGISFTQIERIVVSSVVPVFTRMLKAAFPSDLLRVIDYKWPFSFDIQLDLPSQIGTDRLVDAEAAVREYGAPCIVVDSGTATTLCAVSRQPDGRPAFLGGAILAGLELSMQSLAQKTAQLSTIDLVAPPQAIGKNTSDAIRSGIILGHAALIDGMVKRFKVELGQTDLPVIATGGISHMMKGLTTELTHFDPDLTLKGIKLIYETIRQR